VEFGAELLSRCTKPSGFLESSLTPMLQGVRGDLHNLKNPSPGCTIARTSVPATKDRAFTEFLPLVAFSLNSAVHSSTKVNPFFALFGVEPCNPVMFAGGSVSDSWAGRIVLFGFLVPCRGLFKVSLGDNEGS
jgi:hypothetical protein